jgi:DNA-binding NtrC family response regulator/predicted ATPase
MADSRPHLDAHPTDRLVGTSAAMVALRGQIRHLASFDSLGSPAVPTLLLQGETGTGKGLVARVLHDSGPRAAGPFIEVNCAAIPETLLEAELFGFEAGAFTDAKRAKPGLFEAASGGTLLLDEIDALPLALQGKLLTAIETKWVRRLGAVAERVVDVKLVAATNASLPEAIATGRFRVDLYHRLAVVVLTLPPLRLRGEDVLLLAEEYLRHYAAAHGVAPKRLNAAAQAWVQGYGWPGNIRELSHVMERVTLLHLGEELDAESLTQLCLTSPAPDTPSEVAPSSLDPAPEVALPAEAEQIRQALLHTGGNVTRAARLLGVSRDTVRYRLQRYGITRPRLDNPPAPSSQLSPRTSARRSPFHPEVVPNERAVPRIPSTTTAWEQKTVAILVLEVTWPAAAGRESLSYEPWTEMARWEQAVVDKVRGFGGDLLQRTAALLIWVFGLPRPLEQLPQRAVHSAQAIRQMALAATAPDMPACPEVRLAVHLGAVQVDGQATVPMARVLAVGDTLALPIRLLGQAASGEILVSPEVGRLVEDWVALEARQLSVPRQDPTRVAGYAVMGVRSSRLPLAEQPKPIRSPFVGRKRELMLLQAVLEQVKADQGQVVSLVGAAGMGKSRLLYEFRQCLIGHRVTYVEGHCLAYGTVMPYLPVAGLLRDHCGIDTDDRPEVLITKVRASLQQTSLDPDANLPYLLHLLGVPGGADMISRLSAEARRARTFETFRQLFFASSQQQPLVLAVENLHWIDPTSEALLASFVEGLAGVSILVLGTFRPGYRPLWGDRSYATQIALQPLRTDASRQVVQSVLADRPLTPALEQQLLAKGEGNPFFLEELGHTVREHEEGSLTLPMPDTIQAVLAARIDRLPTVEKRLLEAASVIGKDVAVPVLQALVAQPEETLHRGLAHLQAAEFLFPRSFGSNPTYTFKHILTQEAVYQSVPGTARRQFHQQVAQVLVEHFPILAATQPERLAHHYTEAGLGQQAVLCWQQAGQRARERSANLEAISHLTRGLEVLKALPDTPERTRQELDLQIALGPALIATKGYAAAEVEQAYARAHELCRQVEEAPQLVPVLFGLRLYYQQRAEFRAAHALEAQLFQLAQRLQDPALLLVSHQALGTSAYWLGELDQARTHLEQGIALYDPNQHRALAFGAIQNPGVACLAFAGRVLWSLGVADQALQRCDEALVLARELAHPFSLVYALGCAAVLHQLRREWPAAQERAEATIALAREQGFTLWLAMGTILHGWVLAVQDQPAQGMVQLRQGLAAYRATGTALAQSYLLALVAEAYLNGGRAEEGLRVIAEALAAVHDSGERCYEAELYRLQGELLLARPAEPHAEAEACFCQALAVARRQQAKSLELRAAMSLARLWQDQGKRDKAGQLLRDIYGWFTEGFDTADLQEAKTLLTALG